MGELSEKNNTFWQVLHAAPGSSHWSVVTPEGVADNGGLVAGAAAGSVLVGFLPSNLLYYSPLAMSADGGAEWSPQFLPAALAAVPNALSIGESGGAVAAVGGNTVLGAAPSLSSWSRLTSALRLSRLFRGCGVTTIDGVAILPTGSPMVATGCRRGGAVGIFTRMSGSWRSDGTTLSGQSGAATSVLRLEASGPTTTVLVATNARGHQGLIALWKRGGGPWNTSAPLTLPAKTSVLASAVGSGGSVAVLTGTSSAGAAAFTIDPGGAWTRLPEVPGDTTAIALPAASPTLPGTAVDAFTVDGESLGIYALTPSGTSWVQVQSSQVPIAYGSSS